MRLTIKKSSKNNSHAGTRTRVGEVKTRYPNRLDYMGPVYLFPVSYLKTILSGWNGKTNHLNTMQTQRLSAEEVDTLFLS